MEFFCISFYIIIFCFIIYRLRFFEGEGISKKEFLVYFLIKVAGALSVGLVYKYYYPAGGDTYDFLFAAEMLHQKIFSEPVTYLKILTGIGTDEGPLQSFLHQMGFWYKREVDPSYNDVRMMIRVNAVIRWFSFGYYQIHAVFFAFFSLIGTTAIYKALYGYLTKNKKEFKWLLFLIPSLLFWCSGVLKETWVLFLLGIILFTIIKILRETLSLSRLLIILLAIFLLALTRIYYLPILLPGILALIISEKSKSRHTGWIFCMTYFLFFLLAFNLFPLLSGENLAELIYLKQKHFIIFAQYTGSGSIIPVTPLEPDLRSIILHAPQALLDCFLHPLPTVSSWTMQSAAAAENILLASIFLFSIATCSFREKRNSAFYFAVFMSVFLLIIIGLTTPVAGALVRFKAPILPFLIFIYLSLANTDRLKTSLNHFSLLFKKSNKEFTESNRS